MLQREACFTIQGMSISCVSSVSQKRSKASEKIDASVQIPSGFCKSAIVEPRALKEALLAEAIAKGKSDQAV